jgi:hypothetical protein
MPDVIDSLKAEFHSLGSDEAIKSFVAKYGLMLLPPDTYPNAQMLGMYQGTVSGLTIGFSHRWYDPSQAFSVRPDINKLALDIQGQDTCYSEFPDSY